MIFRGGAIFIPIVGTLVAEQPIGFQHEGLPLRELEPPAFPAAVAHGVFVIGFVLPIDVVVEALWPIQGFIERSIWVLWPKLVHL